MGIFGDQVDLNNTRAPSGGGYYYEPGEYESEITAFKRIDARNKGTLFVLETRILKSTNPERPAGACPTLGFPLWGKSADVTPGKVAAAMQAAAGLNPYNPKDQTAISSFDWNAFAASALEDAQPLKGCRIHVQVLPKAPGKNYHKEFITPSEQLSDFQKKMKTAIEAELAKKGKK